MTGAGCSLSSGPPPASEKRNYTLRVTSADATPRVCVVRAGSATAQVTVTFTASQQVRIDGFAVRDHAVDAGEFMKNFVVRPFNAKCSLAASGINNAEVSFGHDIDNPPVVRWVEMDTHASTGKLTVALECHAAGYADGAATATFDVTGPCSQPLTADTPPPQGQWTTACTSNQRGNKSTPYYAKRYTFALTTASNVTIELTPDDNTDSAYLDLLHPPGSTADSLHAIGTNPRISVENLPVGTYTIETTHREEQTTGGFTLTHTITATETTPTKTAPPADGCLTDLRTLSVFGRPSARRTGAWARSPDCDSVHRGAAFSARYFTFTLEFEQIITIDLESKRGTYMYLLDGHGTGGSPRPNAVLSRPVASTDSRFYGRLATGDYTIEATTRESGVLADFELSVTVQTGGFCPLSE